MTTRNLELQLRVKASAGELKSLDEQTRRLTEAVERSQRAFAATQTDAQKLAAVFGALSKEEAASVTNTARMVTAIEQATAARERAATAAQATLAAETRVQVVQEQLQRSSLQTAAAQEKLLQAQSRTAQEAQKTAAGEERVATAREGTRRATANAEKAEIEILRARENLRKATAQAEAAEERLNRTRQSGGLSAQIMRGNLDAITSGFKAFALGGAVTAAGAGLLQFGRDSIQASSDAEQAMGKFRAVFGDLSDSVVADLERMAEVNKRSLFDLVDFSSRLQDTFVPLGFAREQAAELSKQIVQLGIDVAAFDNIAESDAIERFTSALVGNHEAVRQFGIVITETTLKEELARLGMEGLTGAALENAKVQARLNLIMRSTADAQGAAVREADSHASALREFDAAVQELQVSAGEQLLPAMKDLVLFAAEATRVLGDKYGKAVLAQSQANVEAANGVDGLIAELRRLDNLKFDFGQRLRGEAVGATTATLDAAEALAREVNSFDEFNAALEEAGVNTHALELRLRALGREANLGEFYENARAAAAALARETQDTLYRNTQELQRRSIELLREQARQVNFVSDEYTAAGNAVADYKAKLDSSLPSMEEAAVKGVRLAEAFFAQAAAQERQKQAFRDAFDNSAIDDLVDAQERLADSQGEWVQATRDNSREIEGIWQQLGDDLTDDQQKALRDRLKDIDEFSAEAIDIYKRLEGDISAQQRQELIARLAELEAAQGQPISVFTGDLEANKQAAEDILAANEEIKNSLLERAYAQAYANLVEAEQYDQAAELAVQLGLMSEAEAALRTEYAQTAGALDNLVASTDFYALTAEEQAKAIEGIRTGLYETSDAALRAAESNRKYQETVRQLGDTELADKAFRQQVVTASEQVQPTTVAAIELDPQSRQFWDNWQEQLQEYTEETWTSTAGIETKEAHDELDELLQKLIDITSTDWVIHTTVQQDGSPSGGGNNGSGGGGGGGGGSAITTTVDPLGVITAAPIQVSITNQGVTGGNIGARTENAVVSALRSAGAL